MSGDNATVLATLVPVGDPSHPLNARVRTPHNQTKWRLEVDLSPNDRPLLNAGRSVIHLHKERIAISGYQFHLIFKLDCCCCCCCETHGDSSTTVRPPVLSIAVARAVDCVRPPNVAGLFCVAKIASALDSATLHGRIGDETIDCVRCLTWWADHPKIQAATIKDRCESNTLNCTI